MPATEISDAPAALVQAKQQIRAEALARRTAMTAVERIEGSLALTAHVGGLELRPGETVSGFWPIRDEIDPRPLMHELASRGHPLCLPIVAKPHLLFRKLDRETKLVPAGFGTSVPDEASPLMRPDVMLVPLAAFDARGGRLGYGKGHYDTAIAALEKDGPILRIGLAFSVQEVDQVPTEPHDQLLHGILTETGLRWFHTREDR
ncbi:5-formyltetrahydrofolate cyclo-ligase [Pannonibacter sp. Pt2]|uniref:5-formyltetrahydrofolate cyclo-ligase n=1 Tax=Pannonibacter anstelovis TaxID=3121537 RepID=A0ABU7ZNI4_9HYPH